jgi:fatty-acid desaturase
MSALVYATIHNKHHRHSDTELDPHGPHRGVWHNIMVGFIEVDPNYVNKRNLVNTHVMWQHKHLLWLGVTFAALWIAVLGWQSYVITVAHFHVTTYLTNNILGHVRGVGAMDRPYLSCVNGSEFNHAHHHRNPSMARFGRFDLPYLMYIRPLNKAKAR